MSDDQPVVDLVELETSIKGLPGVLGCAIFTSPDGALAEIQAFTRAGVDRSSVQDLILDEVAKRGLEGALRKIFVFELEAESLFGDRETLERAAELAEQEARVRGPAAPTATPPPVAPGGRAPLLRVVLSSTEWTSQAEVALGPEGDEAIGLATGDKTQHGLKILGEAALEAVARVVRGVSFRLKGAALVAAAGHEAVLMVVEIDEGLETLGAALVRDGPVSEAAVRATLDAVNRRLAFAR